MVVPPIFRVRNYARIIWIAKIIAFASSNSRSMNMTSYLLCNTDPDYNYFSGRVLLKAELPLQLIPPGNFGRYHTVGNKKQVRPMVVPRFYRRCSCSFRASWRTWEKLTSRSRAAALSHAGRVTVRLTDRFTCAIRMEGM